jgi:hypothetical protein
MHALSSAAATLAFLAVGVVAGQTVTATTTCTSVSVSTKTVYKTINDCAPISTTVTPCSQCTPCVVTAWTQLITSTTTSTYPTSTYCPTPGYYTECACSVDSPQYVYYNEPCTVEYICPYQDWYFLDSKVVQVYVKNGKGQILGGHKENWGIGPTVVPVPVVTYIPTPTTVVINDITINVTVAPTYITYTTDATSTVTTTSTVTATVSPNNPGTPVSTFQLTGTLNGEDVVIVQEGGSLVVAPAGDTTGVAFTLTSTGQLMTADGSFVALTFANGQAGPFTYGAALRKRAIADGTYFGVFGSGTFSLTIDGTSITIQVCSGNLLSGGDGLMGGCVAISLSTSPVTLPSSAISSAPASSAPVSSPSSAPASTTPASSAPTSAPSSAPTGSDSPVSQTPIVSSEPSSIASAAPSASANLTLNLVGRRARRGFRFDHA